MTIIDGDCVDVTNKNRQLPALDSNIGKAKAEIMAIRFRDINPDIQLHVINDFIKDDRMIDILEMAKYDYVVGREFHGSRGQDGPRTNPDSRYFQIL